jgi:hypothetical protein
VNLPANFEINEWFHSAPFGDTLPEFFHPAKQRVVR